VAREVGTEGKWVGRLTSRASQAHGGSDRQRQFHGRQLDGQVRNIAEVTTAVANGDLSKKITVDVKGEILRAKSSINHEVDQLSRSRQR